MAEQALLGTYKDFADFATRNGIRLQQPGMLTSNNDDVLMAAMANNAAIAANEDPNSKIGYATALNQTTATATVVLGEQMSATQGAIKLFSFDDGKSEARSFDGVVTIGADGKASIDLNAGVQHFYGSNDERNAYENLSSAFNRRDDIAALKTGPFAIFAQQQGLPVGGIDSHTGQYEIKHEGAPDNTDELNSVPNSLKSCAPLSPAFAACVTNTYSGANVTTKTQVLAVDGGAMTASADTSMSRPMEDSLGEFDKSKNYAKTTPGIKTFP